MKKPLVIYVDDSQDALDLASVIVQDDKRFTLKGFRTETELNMYLEKNTPQALLLDLNLGQNLTGSILSIKLRQRYPNIPIAIYTSYEKTRVKQLIPETDLVSKKTVIWQKSEVGVGELSDKIAELLGAQ